MFLSGQRRSYPYRPFAVDGRDGGGPPIGYNTLMRIWRGCACRWRSRQRAEHPPAAAEPTNLKAIVQVANVLLEAGDR